MYGGSTKVQSEPLNPAHEYDVEGIAVTENKEGNDSSTYPFAIYDTLNKAKQEHEKDNGEIRGRRIKRRRGAPRSSQEQGRILAGI